MASELPMRLATTGNGAGNKARAISITLDTYSDVLPGLQEEAAATVAALIVG